MEVSLNIVSQIKNYFENLQNTICHGLENEERNQHFQEDLWQHKHGGGGRTRILNGGYYFERAGVNFSHVYGQQLPVAVTQKNPHLIDANFQAMGVSVVIHPRNPFVPTAHFNVRFFIAEKTGIDPVWWFGGGYDLTPYYGFVDDCQHWHRIAKQACDPFDPEFYSRFKKNADDYFYLKHRNEQRGIGGIFFDYLNANNHIENCFAFTQSIGNSFLLAYLPIVKLRKDTPYHAKHREFQCYRRGRYVEFNLLYDKGTAFGLQSSGRTESILMSLPPQVVWKYNWQPEIGSDEERLYKEFLIPKDWI